MSEYINSDIADGGGSGHYEDPYAERRADLQKQIGELSGKKTDLEGLKESINTTNESLKKDVVDPIIEPYDLSEDNKWRGLQYNEAHTMFSTISGNVSTFESTVTTVIGQIGSAISELEEMISKLQSELDSLPGPVWVED